LEVNAAKNQLFTAYFAANMPSFHRKSLDLQPHFIDDEKIPRIYIWTDLLSHIRTDSALLHTHDARGNEL
jgi:hypothetical protein